MFVRTYVPMTESEFDLLQTMSEADMRYPKEQLRFLIRQEAERRGLLSNVKNIRVTHERGGHVLVDTAAFVE